MKTYNNGMKATEFSKKQISVIYSKAKNGELKVEKWVIKDFYDLADFYNYDDNGNAERDERDILRILDNVFAGKIEEAQNLINSYTEKNFNLLSKKAQAKADRNILA